MAMLNAIFNVQAEAGWPTGRACQLFDNFKCKYSPNDKLLSAQMIKKLYKSKLKNGEDPKVMCDKIEALKVKYQDQAEILDNNTIVTHLFLVWEKLCKKELTQAQVEAEVNNTEIMYESLISCMNVAWRIESSSEGVMQVGDTKVALMSMGFKEKCHSCGNMCRSKINVPRRISLRKGKETRSLWASVITVVRWDTRLQTAGKIKPVKTRGPRIGGTNKTRK